MEMWDCYTWDRQKLGRQHRRGEPMAEGEYHLDGEPAGGAAADTAPS